MRLLPLLLACLALGAMADGTIQRPAWTFDRSQLAWDPSANPEDEKAKGTLSHVAGWSEYDFTTPTDGWHELKLWFADPTWCRDVFLDGELLFYQSVGDSKLDRYPPPAGGFKEANLWLPAGKHRLRFRRTSFPACLPSQWELVPANGRPEASIRMLGDPQRIQRAGTELTLKFLGGRPGAPTSYKLFLLDSDRTEAGTLTFPATDRPIEREVAITFPKQGQFLLIAASEGTTLRPADLKAGTFTIVDVDTPPPPAKELKTTTLVDIDCVKNTLNGKLAALGADYFENRCHTATVTRGGLTYRELTPTGELPPDKNPNWGCEAFSYKFDLPDKDHLYRLLVDYPDDDRRTMGFPVKDFPVPALHSFISTGGVETGDHYQLSHSLLTHEAYFFCNEPKGVVMAVVNLLPGWKAAATRIRVERVDDGLPAAPAGVSGGRAMGCYFEENGRWNSYFGGAPELESMERWARWNRYLGTNLMFATVMCYGGVHWPSRALEGWDGTMADGDTPRLLGLVADKYGQQFVPEIHFSMNAGFERAQFGLDAKDGKMLALEPGADATVLRDLDGNTTVSWYPFAHNALHPKVQAKYLELVGELADMLKDCKSFVGVSSRLMPGWVCTDFNILPGLKHGYDDWTIAQFEKDTGLKVPGVAGDPKRFHQRFDFLTNQQRERWLSWRCGRIFDYHRRLLARIRQAKPDAKLFLTYHGPDQASAIAKDMLGQMREMGLDPALYAQETGIVIVPGGMYGRRFSTPLSDAETLDAALYDPQSLEASRLGGRGRYLYMNYFEYGESAEFEKLGGKRTFVNDSCTPGGVNERELYAMFLADCDSSFIINGGAGWIFGTPSALQPFLREFKALPAERFEPWDKARDPIAVWFRKDGGKLLFYAVNRLPVKVDASLGLSGWLKSARTLADGKPAPLVDDKLEFQLEPYMMKSFEADGLLGVSLDSFSCRVPQAFVEKVKPIALFSQDFAAKLASRELCPELTVEEADSSVASLRAAAAGFAKGEVWKAWRVDSLPLVKAYCSAGRFPPGMWERSVPHGLVDQPGAPKLGEAVVLGDVRGRLSSCTGLGLAADGGFWASSPSQLMRFDADGNYVKGIPTFNPDPAGFAGDPRYYHLPTPKPFERMQSAALADGRPGGRDWSTPLYLFDPANGRPFKTSAPMGPFTSGAFLANCPGGELAVSEGNPACRTVRKLRQEADGSFLSLGDLRPWNATAGAADAAGNLYLALAEGGVKTLSPEGKEVEGVVAKAKFNALAVSPDGNTLRAAAGRTLTCFQRGADGKFTESSAIKLEADIEALLPLRDGRFVVGFNAPAPDGAVVALMNQDGTRKTVVKGLGEIEDQCLDGPTQLKLHAGALCYAAHGKLWSLKPGADKATLLYDPKRPRFAFEAFAIAPNGDIYLASHWNGSGRGLNLYRARETASGHGALEYLNGGKPLVVNPYFVNTDMEATADGGLILRLLDAQGKAKLCKWSPDSGKSVPLAPLADRDCGYGLELQPDDGLLVGGGATRSIARFAPDGSTRWSWNYDVHHQPGTRDARQASGVSLDSKGRTWVADTARSMIMCLDQDGKFLASYGRFGGVDERSGLAFRMPAGLKILKDADGAEWLYVADIGNQRLVKARLEP